jgi:hypothetical protein
MFSIAMFLTYQGPFKGRGHDLAFCTIINLAFIYQIWLVSNMVRKTYYALCGSACAFLVGWLVLKLYEYALIFNASDQTVLV